MRFALALASVALLAGCASEHHYATPPSAPPLRPSTAAPPAAKPPPSFTGTAGPLTKANVEKYMDAQEADLRAQLRGKGTVARRGETLVVSIPTDRLFDRMVLSSSGHDMVADLGRILAHYDHTTLELGCYTDTSGGADQNLAVSQKRAEAVAEVLWQSGVTSARLTAKGYGDTVLRFSNGTDPRNRRIELKIVPKLG